MNLQTVAVALTAGLLIWLADPAAFAATTTVPAGQTLTLSNDLVLTGADILEVNGTLEKPCSIEGNGYRIKTAGEWTGRLKISHSTLKHLGKAQAVIKVPSPNGGYPSFKIDDPDAPAFEATATGNAEIHIERCTFDQCSFLRFTANGNATLVFRGNTVLENALFPVSELPDTTRACISVTGHSPAKKFFQGNRIYKGTCQLHCAQMLVGGTRDEESNLVIGLRAKIEASGSGTVIQGNYVHVLMPGSEAPPHFAYWSQVSTFTPGEGTVAEHNIIRDGEWIVQFVEGEFRYNVICDIADHNLMRNGSVGRIHHNLFFGSDPRHRRGSMNACIYLVYKPKTPGGGIEIFNNTFDGCGWLPVSAVDATPEGFVKSLRNNVCCNFKWELQHRLGEHDTAAIMGGVPLASPSVAYADYNGFFNPLSPSKKNYGGQVVKDKTLRKDDGFGKHDLPAGGEIDAQVDPKFKGPLPQAFPFKDEDIKAGKVTLSQMLGFFRNAYTPAAGSPLIGAGDPADGKDAFIGAIAPAGCARADDRFGKFSTADGPSPAKR